jgi:hypothetical protein
MIHTMPLTGTLPAAAAAASACTRPRPRSAAWLWLALVGAAVITAPARPARGSIMIALDLPELVRQSEHIAVVEVGQVQAAWDPRHERIYSTIELKVIESWKSATGAAVPPPAHLTVVQPGGTVGDITMTVTGLGTFMPGERSLVFLRGPSQSAQVVGMTQGKRPLRYETVSRRWLVTPPDLRQAKLIRPAPPLRSTQPVPVPALQSQQPRSPVPGTVAPVAATTATAAALGARDLPLDDLRAEVRKLLAAAGSR